MIRGDEGKVTYEGMAKDLMGELMCIMRAFVVNNVTNPLGLISAMQIALEGQGVEMIRVTEDEIKEILQEIAEEDNPPKKQQKHSSDDADDFFTALWGDDNE